MADRTQRIQSIIGKNLSEIITFELKKKSIGIVSISEVKVAQNFAHAKVYVTFIGAKHPQQNLDELNACKGFIRSALAKRLDIRKTPELVFYIDDTYEKAQRINDILSKINKD